VKAKPGQAHLLGVEPAFTDEKRYERQIRERAEHHGWMVMKVGKTPVVNKGKKFWITATSLKGWPDLTLMHPDGWLLFLEVKGENGSPSAEQKIVMRALQRAASRTATAHFQAFVVWPKDWPLVERLLARPAPGRTIGSPALPGERT
jgi:hypothetical protein